MKTGRQKGCIPWNKGKTGIYSTDTLSKMSIAKRGIKLSKQHKENMSLALKGKVKRSGNKGKHHSLETRRKISEATRGEKNGGWKGGISKEAILIRQSTEYRLWREAVFDRDSYTCQKTRERGGKLVAHHIQSFSENTPLRFVIDNGITLSDKSHREFHRIFGRTNNTIQQTEKYLVL